VETVLVVDDEPIVREVVVRYLEREGYRTLEAADGNRARELLQRESPSLVVLDLMLPGTDGLALCRWIRSHSSLPVIMLTARGEDVNQVRGLELGADDYVAKPFSHLALMARIKAVLRRAELPPPIQALPDFQAGSLTIHFENQEVTVGGDVVKLTPIEYKLLYHLVRNAGHLLPHQALLDRVWGGDYEAGPEYLKVFVSRLRSKLRRPGSPEFIETERGRGYRFVRPHAAAS